MTEPTHPDTIIIKAPEPKLHYKVDDQSFLKVFAFNCNLDKGLGCQFTYEHGYWYFTILEYVSSPFAIRRYRPVMSLPVTIDFPWISEKECEEIVQWCRDKGYSRDTKKKAEVGVDFPA